METPKKQPRTYKNVVASICKRVFENVITVVFKVFFISKHIKIMFFYFLKINFDISTSK